MKYVNEARHVKLYHMTGKMDHHHDVGRMRQRLPSFSVLLYCVSPYISLHCPRFLRVGINIPFLTISHDCVFVAEMWAATWSLSFW